MRKTLWAVFAAAVLSLAAPGLGRAGIITFDEPIIAGVNNPVANTFGGASALTEFYAPMGVHFNGPYNYYTSTPNGGGILSDDGGFGVSAHSGTNFLAFNRNASYPGNGFGWWWTPGGTAIDPETVTFDDPQSSVSIWAAGGFKAHTFQLQAFDAAYNLLATDTLTTKGWSQLSVSGNGIASVVLTEIGKWGDSWVYDDLSFTPIESAGIGADVKSETSKSPEPASLVLLGLGGAGFAGWRWRPWRRAKTA